MSAHNPTRSLLIDSAFSLASIAADKFRIRDKPEVLDSLRRSRLLFEQLIIELVPLSPDGSPVSADLICEIISELGEIECTGKWDALGLFLEYSGDSVAAWQDAA